MQTLGSFTSMYSLSKTLRFGLIPVGKTEEHIVKSGLLTTDEERKGNYSIVKKLIDRYHKQFLSEALSNLKLDWVQLSDAIHDYRSDGDEDKLKKTQDEYRKAVSKAFTAAPEYKKLFNEKLLSDLLPEAIENGFDCSEQEQKALASFKGFGTYFVGFHQNRKNIYKYDAISTAIPFRLVNQNFPKYIENLNSYNKLKRIAPEVIEQAQTELESLLEGLKLDDVFRVEAYNNYLNQSGIDFYNSILGGYADEAGNKYRGLNEFGNLLFQQNKDAVNGKRIKLLPLYKQILSDREAISYLPEKFVTGEDVIEAIEAFAVFIAENNAFIDIEALFGMLADGNVNFADIYISQKELTYFSTKLFGDWGRIKYSLQDSKEAELAGKSKSAREKSLEKYMKAEQYSLEEIISAVGEENWQAGIEWLADEVKKMLVSVDNTSLIEEIKASGKDPKQDEVCADKIKILLDSYKDLMHLLKPFSVSSDLERDNAFYGLFDQTFENASEIVSLYNKVRNYVTQKPYETEKFKLNFNAPTLLNGWDKNKERDNCCILLKKDGLYYLGIMNMRNKLKAAELENDDSVNGFQKMVYKLLPGPNKMLPKVFLSRKGIETYRPSEYILEGYQAEKHKHGPTFDLKFCHDLIDFFKECIAAHPDWSQFGFRFSDTSSYEDISKFYKEVSEQGYKLSFVNLPEEKVMSWVDDGRLYLFKIWNKDFSPGATGNKNLHTLYWEALFSEANLQNTCFKLNGDAELFYRRKSIETPYIHKKGSIKVNKRDIAGSPIPSGIWNEVFKYANQEIGREKLSDEARALLDNNRVRLSKVKHDLVKDKRFTENKYFFHVPVTINYNASGNERLNQRVNEFLQNNKDVNIIGLDRGERNLVYLSLINQKGEILEQKSFNVVNNMDYHAKLDQSEKDRQNARRDWKTIGNIKELKDGYISQIVHEISRMIVENNAIVVMEDLNYGFKRGRFKIEKQVYQKFEKALIEKLNYLVFKNCSPDEKCGVLHGLQLTNKFESFNKMGKQNGVLFYIPAGYTSKIDPATGFVDLFNRQKVSTENARRKFFASFDDICYDSARDMFAFSFNYDSFNTYQESARKDWVVYTNGKRIVGKKTDGKWQAVDVYPTADIKQALSNAGISFDDGHNLKMDIIDGDNKLLTSLFYAFQNTIKLRNSNPLTDEDYIISPVMSEDGVFFDSRDYANNHFGCGLMPIDADANGAYHIALKGKMLLDRINEYGVDIGYAKMKIDNASWFDFVQNEHNS